MHAIHTLVTIDRKLAAVTCKEAQQCARKGSEEEENDCLQVKLLSRYPSVQQYVIRHVSDAGNS